MAETTTCDGTFVPLDPVQRYEWDRMWDMIYAKMLPRVIERVQAKIQQERRAA